ncbi:MOSC domain-containing protein YiiM [Actinacidiphila alni]|uniref:MOSC domain-containing protein YiiM n=1 Tax=Actinacidiphila alni TaxID=380248 RepID=A0A1I2DHV9_9ACTN|nr:MOSC domain-containing protein [Actinacidiphila alni]SFE80094.1 MOSC domain-containing protein YiiM [Actinacidiphila alni]
MPPATLLSVNIGRPRPNPWKRLPATGIDKRPVTGPVRVSAPGPKGTGAVGLAGDRAHDVKHHGGADQAVYAYAREDLDHWGRELGRTFADGFFGENLTTAGIDVNAALIGERWRIGAAGTGPLLEISCPRIPCATFAGRLEEAGWLRRFTREALPGPYLRVLEPGEIRAGDPVDVVHRPGHEVTVAVSFRALTTEPELLPLLVGLDAFPAEDRAAIRRRLDREPH